MTNTSSFKATRIALHINTGTKREDGKNKQTHAVLWNSEAHADHFFGGVAEVQGKELKIITAQAEGEQYANPVKPLALFVNRNKAGRVMALTIARNGTKLGELKFKKDINGKTMITGTYNDNGLQFDDQYHVVAGVEGNRAIFAEITGGLREEVLASMINMKEVKASKAAANEDAAQAAA